MPYQIRLTTAAQKDLMGFTEPVRTQIRNAIRTLADNPRPPGVVKVEGFKGLYRFRSGAYRIVYAIQDSHLLILVTAIGDRKNIYPLLKRRLK